MRLIYVYPETHGPEGNMAEAGPVTDHARALEASGWHGIAFTEHPAPGAKWLSMGGHQAFDPFIALAFAAAATESLQLLTYLSVLPYRNPLLLAKTAATLDVLSNGRMTLGLGTGYLKGEFRALGVDFDQRNVAFDEALEVMPLAWTGEPFDYEGSTFSAREVQCLPAPARPIPIWIGGNAKITRRRVAEHAQGWMPLGGSAELLATTRTPAVGTLDELAAKIADVKAQAGARADELSFTYLYSDQGLQDDPTSDTDRHLDALGRMSEAGITHVTINGPKLGMDASRTWITAVGETYVS